MAIKCNIQKSDCMSNGRHASKDTYPKYGRKIEGNNRLHVMQHKQERMTYKYAYLFL